MNQEEEIIWKNIQQKDQGAFEQYYRDNYTRFFLMACKYLRDAGPAQEIVNDVFLKLWQDGEHIQIASSLRSYIYRAVINRSINAAKHQRRIQRDQKELSLRSTEGVEERLAEDNELKLRIFRAIDELPEQCRKVFRMSRFDELKQQEIADRLGISIKTVKNHITYALKHMNKAMDDSLIGWIAITIFLMS